MPSLGPFDSWWMTPGDAESVRIFVWRMFTEALSIGGTMSAAQRITRPVYRDQGRLLGLYGGCQVVA